VTSILLALALAVLPTGRLATAGTQSTGAGLCTNCSVPLALEAGFPQTTQLTGSAATTIASPSFTTAGASMLTVSVGQNNLNSGTLPLVTCVGTGGASGLTFTRLTHIEDAGTAVGCAIWYAYSSAALSSSTVSCTIPGTPSSMNAMIGVWSWTGASSTIGNSGISAAPSSSTSNPQASVAAAATGSYVWGSVGEGNDTTTLAGTAIAGTTIDSAGTPSNFTAQAIIHSTNVTPDTSSRAYGSSRSVAWSWGCVGEVKAQ